MVRDYRFSGRSGLEGQRDPVHAVAQARRLRTIVEHMAEMPAATAAMDLRPLHAQGIVLRRGHGALQRRPEARPTGAAVELGGRGEQVEVAAGAGEVALALLMQER